MQAVDSRIISSAVPVTAHLGFNRATTTWSDPPVVTYRQWANIEYSLRDEDGAELKRENRSHTTDETADPLEPAAAFAALATAFGDWLAADQAELAGSATTAEEYFSGKLSQLGGGKLGGGVVGPG